MSLAAKPVPVRCALLTRFLALARRSRRRRCQVGEAATMAAGKGRPRARMHWGSSYLALCQCSEPSLNPYMNVGLRAPSFSATERRARSKCRPNSRAKGEAGHSATARIQSSYGTSPTLMLNRLSKPTYYGYMAHILRPELSPAVACLLSSPSK